MRLIDVRTLELVDFIDSLVPPYAILSHNWEDGEVSFQDFRRRDLAKTKKGYLKIGFVCEQARSEHLDYVWVDTCCIDKGSSAELQEAINSMYRWYSRADVCFVYLSDILPTCPELHGWQLRKGWVEKEDGAWTFWHDAFAKSVWFTRGWTLQELIAPTEVKFFSSQGTYIGRKAELEETISKATGIDKNVLNHTRSLRSISVAKRMSWAARRKTSRVEDRAYSLLGIFGVSMPMLYGEGSAAFTCLQEEIIRSTSDQSILAWSSRACNEGCLLAESPADFESGHSVVPWGRPGAFEMTNQGLRMYAPVVFSQESEHHEYLALLNCRYEGDFSGTLALRVENYSDIREYHLCLDDKGETPHSEVLSSRLAFVSLDIMQQAEAHAIHITRKFEHRPMEPSFWITFANTHTLRQIEIRDFGPDWHWNTKARTLRFPSDVSKARGSGLIRLASRFDVMLLIGYDKVKLGKRRNANPHKDNILFVPGVYAWPHVGKLKLRDRYEYWYSCSHADEACLTQTGCRNTPTTAKVQDAEGRDLMTTDIKLEELMGELVYVVTIATNEQHEAETLLSNSIFELDANESVPIQITSQPVLAIGESDAFPRLYGAVVKLVLITQDGLNWLLMDVTGIEAANQSRDFVHYVLRLPDERDITVHRTRVGLLEQGAALEDSRLEATLKLADSAAKIRLFVSFEHEQSQEPIVDPINTGGGLLSYSYRVAGSTNARLFPVKEGGRTSRKLVFVTMDGYNWRSTNVTDTTSAVLLKQLFCYACWLPASAEITVSLTRPAQQHDHDALTDDQLLGLMRMADSEATLVLLVVRHDESITNGHPAPIEIPLCELEA